MIRLLKIVPNNPNIKVLIKIKSVKRKIPPIIFVKYIVFLLNGLDITKSTLFCLNKKQNNDDDKEIGITYIPKCVIILRVSKLINTC